MVYAKKWIHTTITVSMDMVAGHAGSGNVGNWQTAAGEAAWRSDWDDVASFAQWNTATVLFCPGTSDGLSSFRMEYILYGSNHGKKYETYLALSSEFKQYTRYR